MNARVLFDDFLAKTPIDGPDIPDTGFFLVTLVRQVNLIETKDFEDVLSPLPGRSRPLNLKQEQQNDEVFLRIILWKNKESLD